MNYYGIDWLANIFFFIYIYLLGKQDKNCLWFAIVGSLLQAIFSVLAFSVANFICNIIFMCLYFRAYIRWNNAIHQTK